MRPARALICFLGMRSRKNGRGQRWRFSRN
jgi:hypothetical protein